MEQADDGWNCIFAEAEGRFDAGPGTPVGVLGDMHGEPTGPRAVTLQVTLKF